MAITSKADLSYYSVWLITRDTDFLKQNVKVNPRIFPRGELQYLVGLAVSHYEQFKVTLTPTTLALELAIDTGNLRRQGITATDAQAIYTALDLRYHLDDKEVPAARVYCRNYLEQKQFDHAISTAAKGKSLVDGLERLEGARLRDEEERSVSIFDANSPDFMQTITTLPTGEIGTGMYELNNLWRGGPRPGEIGIVGAPTGIGKSMCLCFMAAAAFWQGKHVLYYTFELTDKQIMGRTAFAVLKKGEADIRHTWDKELVGAAKRAGASLPTGSFEARAGMMTWPELVADLEQYKRDHGAYPDLLILDSADDIQPLHARDRIHEQLKEAYTFMRQLARQKEMVIWTSGQLTRDAVEKARVNLRNIGDAFAKAQRSHYVIAFAQTREQSVSKSGPEMSLFVLKDSQYGSTGWVLDLRPDFGPGKSPEQGFPGYEVKKVYRDGGDKKDDQGNGQPA